MSISKQEYILRSLSKIRHKKWEVFIISRVLHGLDDDEIEFVTQQLVRLSDGTRALTDLYFPQFNLHLEIDEPHHEKQVDKDKRREQDIINMTGHTIERIKVSDNTGRELEMKEVRKEVDSFIQRIISLKSKAISFTPWDWKNRYSANSVIERGHVSIDDNVVFHTQVEALRCFGFKGKGWQRGEWIIPDGSHDSVWFPRLYHHGKWHNELADNGKIIYERAINKDGVISITKQRESNLQYPKRKVIVFAKAKDVLGLNLLRYVGSFQMNLDQNESDVLRFDRFSIQEAVR